MFCGNSSFSIQTMPAYLFAIIRTHSYKHRSLIKQKPTVRSRRREKKLHTHRYCWRNFSFCEASKNLHCTTFSYLGSYWLGNPFSWFWMITISHYLLVCLWMCDGLRSTWFQMAINPCWMLLDLVERSLFYWPKTFFHVKSQISCGDSHDRQFRSERFNQPLHLTKQVLLACTTIFPFHLNLAFLCLLVDAFVYDFIWLYF